MSNQTTHIDPETTIKALRKKITRLEKALAQPQQELEYCTDYHCAGDCGQPHNQKEMRELLASQPQQEPVAWVTVEKGVCATTRSANFSRIPDGQYQLYVGPLKNDVVAAITTLKALGYVYNKSKTCKEGEQWVAPQPAQRKPLTDEEIENIAAQTLFPIAFGRAIEAAHGIKENT